jgi:hypothetical protein
MDAIGSAHSGMQASLARINASAAAIVRAQATEPGAAGSPQTQPVSGQSGPAADPVPRVEAVAPNIVDEQVNILITKTHFLANLSVLRTANELHRNTLDRWA